MVQNMEHMERSDKTPSQLQRENRPPPLQVQILQKMPCKGRVSGRQHTTRFQMSGTHLENVWISAGPCAEAALLPLSSKSSLISPRSREGERCTSPRAELWSDPSQLQFSPLLPKILLPIRLCPPVPKALWRAANGRSILGGLDPELPSAASPDRQQRSQSSHLPFLPLSQEFIYWTLLKALL